MNRESVGEVPTICLNGLLKAVNTSFLPANSSGLLRGIIKMLIFAANYGNAGVLARNGGGRGRPRSHTNSCNNG